MRDFLHWLLGFPSTPSDSVQQSDEWLAHEEERQKREVQERLNRVREQLAVLDRRRTQRGTSQ